MSTEIGPKESAAPTDSGGPTPVGLEARLTALESSIATEKSDREAAMISQEHRLIPAISNVVTVLLSKGTEKRRTQLPKAIGALFWCLVPSGGTASVGIIAILSLMLAWQQTRLLSAQNYKIDVQNVLAEAQRRSGLMFETAAIFQQLEDEKAKATPTTGCQGDSPEMCWNTTATRPIFVPSRATTGRIAALTQALRPYRYLSVEDDTGPYRFRNAGSLEDLCPESIPAVLPPTES